MRKGLLHISLVASLFFTAGVGQAFGQTADVESGCIPLTVKFDAPDLSAYYWDFRDGSSSELKSPEHTYIQPGTFAVQLFEGVGGSLVGELVISVYPKPEIDIVGDPLGGCAPLQVQFEGNVQADPGISIVSYKWAFGDGLASTAQNPLHTYVNQGTFSVSLQIETDPAQCRVTELVENYITVESVSSFFRLDQNAACDAPASFQITQLVPEEPGNTYFWDFGNGETSDVHNPGPIIFEEEGTFTITLTVTNEAGCSREFQRVVTIGRPQLDIFVPDTVCLGYKADFVDLTGTSNSVWNFGATASPMNSGLQSVSVVFSQPGPVNVTLSSFSDPACISDTSFTVFVEVIDLDLEIDPTVACFDQFDITVSATPSNLAEYLWNSSIDGGPVQVLTYTEPIRDSLYINRSDTIWVTLNATSTNGCFDQDTIYYIHRKPDAYFLTSPVRGCGPLNVSFRDSSLSNEPIVRWTWLYGDGTSEEFNTKTDPSHTYTQPGEYYVRLIIENADGCIDTSAGTWIYVGENITPEFTIDKSEVCLGDSISIEFTNTDPRIDAWHFDTDDHRFDHCWSGTSATHIFETEPGTFPATATVEYNGCFTTVTAGEVTVNGAKADLSYMINCDAPHDVMLWNNSLNANRIEWTFSPTETSSEDSLTWTYPDTGIYTIVLEAEDTGSGCPSTFDSATVHIVDLQASFTVDSLLCAGQEYRLDASGSQDVDNDCSQGYLWILPDVRPREVSTSSIMHAFPPGLQPITLVVESINGCRDTTTREIRAYDMQSDFEMDKTRICDPSTVVFTDMTTADTTIVSYQWSFGKEGAQVDYTFTDLSPPDSIEVSVTITDAIGCMRVVEKEIDTYEPVTSIEFDIGPNICEDSEVAFTAEDFTEEGSFLNFDWDFGQLGNSNEQSPTVLFDDPGGYRIILQFTEDATGCSGSDTIDFNVVMQPMADFMSNFDTLNPICHPEVGDFTNTSITDGPVNYLWSMSNGVQTGTENPVIAFGKGTYDVRLIVSSIYGCADTTLATYTLVGPEGTFIASDDLVCKDEEITFTLMDTADVGSFTWDFGDGTRVENENPVTHIYGFNPPGGTTLVTLVLESGETGCTLEDSLSIGIAEIFADFNAIDSLQYCKGQFQFMDQSIGANTWNWDFGNGESSNEQNPVALYDSPGMYSVTLYASETESGCEDEITQEIEVSFEDFIFMPNVFTPNNDSRNDYFTPVILPGYEEFVEVKEFKIYNRWGNLLYDNQNPDMGWDGTDSGADAPATVYAYAVEVEIIDCTTLRFKGNVTLIR